MDESTPPWHVGCVSYLNAKPLIHGLDQHQDVRIHFDVPSNLLDMLLQGSVHIALCPVVDYLRHPDELVIVPAGGICSAGQTFTVRLYSRTPLQNITHVHVDTHSHTSIVLMQILLAELFDIHPQLIPFDAGSRQAKQTFADYPAMLLIGDKVVTDGPSEMDYPHQLDLGEAWRKLTDLPFVFATWLARRETDLGKLPAMLKAQQQKNRDQRDVIAAMYAPRHHWPEDLARRYLRQLLHYNVGRDELQAIATFANLGWKWKLLDHEPAPLKVIDIP